MTAPSHATRAGQAYLDLRDKAAAIAARLGMSIFMPRPSATTRRTRASFSVMVRLLW